MNFKKTVKYFLAFFLLGFGLLLCYGQYANVIENPNSVLKDIIYITGLSLVSLIFFLPGIHLSGFIKNNRLFSRLNIYSILSLFHLFNSCIYLLKFIENNYEVDRNLAIYCFIVSLICFYLRKKGKVSSKNIASNISSLTDFKYKEFDDNQLKKLLGNNTKIISKKNVCFPFNFHIKLESKSDIEVQLMAFDVSSWNEDIRKQNAKNAENKKLRTQYDNLMMQYENAKQLYNNAKMQRNQIIANAKKGNKLLPYLANPIGSPPKQPKKPNYFKIIEIKKDDYFTKDKGTELFKNFEIKHNEDFNYFNFFDANNFSKIFDIAEWQVISKLLKNIYISSEKKDLGHINSDFKPKDQDIKIKFISSFSYSDLCDGGVGDSADLLKKCITNFEEKYKIDWLKNKTLKNEDVAKDLKLVNHEIKSNKIHYSIRDLNYLPFLRVEIEDKKGNKKIEIIDYISRSVVSF